MAKTYLDDLIAYKDFVMRKICEDQKVVGLIFNNPDIDMESEEVDDMYMHHIYDYNYIDGAIQRTDAYIMVDCELISASSGSMNIWNLYVEVVCAKAYNHLDPKIFKGLKGNRRDNIARYVDLLINNTNDLGIGNIILQSASVPEVPDTFTAITLTYRVDDFRYDRIGIDGT